MEINYNNAVRSTLNNFLPGVGISKKALRLVNMALLKLNKKIVDECRNNFTGKRKICIITVERAINKIFKGSMNTLAFFAAKRCILKYKLGVLKFVTVKQETRKKTPFKVQSHFIKGISPIALLIDSEIKIEKDGMLLFGSLVQEGFNIMVNFIHRTEQGGGTLGTNDIVKAVDHYLAPIMAKHAITEGNRNVLMFSQGLTERKAEDFELLRKKSKRATDETTPETKPRFRNDHQYQIN